MKSSDSTRSICKYKKEKEVYPLFLEGMHFFLLEVKGRLLEKTAHCNATGSHLVENSYFSPLRNSFLLSYEKKRHCKNTVRRKAQRKEGKRDKHFLSKRLFYVLLALCKSPRLTSATMDFQFENVANSLWTLVDLKEECVKLKKLKKQECLIPPFIGLAASVLERKNQLNLLIIKIKNLTFIFFVDIFVNKVVFLFLIKSLRRTYMSISFDSAVNIGMTLVELQIGSENPEILENNHLEEGKIEEDILNNQIILERQERRQREVFEALYAEEEKESDSPRVIHLEQDQNIEQRIILRPAKPEPESKESETQQADQNQVGFHLTEEDQAKIDRYIRNSTYNSLERYLIFYMDRSNKVKIREEAHKASLWGALFGATGVPGVLNLTSIAINYIYPETALAMKMAKVASYYLSSFAGGAVLGYVVTPLVHVGTMPIRNHPIYHNWRAERITDEVFNKHRKFLKEQPEFKDLIYKLSRDLIDCPVKDSNGNLHDKSIILEKIRETNDICSNKSARERKIIMDQLCPYGTKLHIKPQDLSPAPEYYLKLIRSIDRLKERLGEAIPEFSREGLNTARESAQNNLREIFHATDIVVDGLLREKRISVEERQEQLEDIKDELFGANEDAN